MRFSRTTFAVAAATVTAAVVAAGIVSANAAGAVTATGSFSKWDTGYTANYTIANGSSSGLTSWTVEFDLPAGTSVGAYWNSTITTSGRHVVVKNASYNGKVDAGQSTSFGFNGVGTGEPANCKINGAACTGGTASPPPPPPTTGGPKPSTSPQPSTSPKPPVTPPPGGVDLSDPRKKDIAMQLVSTAENSSLDWKAQYKYIEDIGDGRGYTAGIIGFCSGTGDMLELVELYSQRKPGNVLAKYLPALRRVDGTSSHAGLDPNFVGDWRAAANDADFKKAQDDERDRVYFNPSVSRGKSDGVRTLGQFIYYDAAVMHGYSGFESIRRKAMARVKTPAQGGDETKYLNAFLDERVIEMKTEEAHSDTSRVDDAQRVFLRNGNLLLDKFPLVWKVYGEEFRINNG